MHAKHVKVVGLGACLLEKCFLLDESIGIFNENNLEIAIYIYIAFLVFKSFENYSAGSNLRLVLLALYTVHSYKVGLKRILDYWQKFVYLQKYSNI